MNRASVVCVARSTCRRLPALVGGDRSGDSGTEPHSTGLRRRSRSVGRRDDSMQQKCADRVQEGGVCENTSIKIAAFCLQAYAEELLFDLGSFQWMERLLK